MRGLTVLVSVLSLLIILSLGLVVYGLVRTPKTTGMQAEMPPLVLPAHSVIKQMTSFQDTLALHVKAGRQEYIYLIDPKTAAIKTRIPVRHEK